MFSRTRRAMLAAMVAGAFITPAASASASDSDWKVVDLGIGNDSQAHAINDFGHVVGSHNSRSFIWRNGKTTYLDTSGAYGFAIDINNRDEVAANIVVNGVSHAAVWGNGVLTDLGVLPGGTNSYVAAINDRGEIAGWSDTGPNHEGLRAFRWRNGVMTDLGILPNGYTSTAADINTAGEIIGSSGMPTNVVRWRRGEPIESLIESASPEALNDRGDITGLTARSQGFLWHRGQLTEFTPPAGNLYIQPHEINNKVQVVGHTDSDAFVWQNGRTTILPRLQGGTSGSAWHINDRSQIVGTSQIGWDSRAVLWTR